MSRRFRPRLTVLAIAFCAGAGPACAATSSADTAALQVALWARGVYTGPVDGAFGRETSAALQALQIKLGLPSTGFFGPLTRKALGSYAKTTLGSRTLRPGASGWDVAAFQFLLAWHGFPSGAFTGIFTLETQGALIRFQHWLRSLPNGLAGRAVFAALQRAPARSPISLGWPLLGPIGSPFGPRGDRFHAGVDLIAAQRTPVIAAGAGNVVFAGWRDGGWGNEITIDHGHGVRAIYAHLSKINVVVGDSVSGGQTIGLVGATGDATGPHLHFELRLNGAAIDPLTAFPPLPPGPASARSPWEPR
jgi:murein DD-endopeptidase MepM/ murein hydrolase activator NlpD